MLINQNLADAKSDRRLVHLISLGCARNKVDSEVMLGGLLQRGWAITDNPVRADAVVVNTCGFIGPAKQESIDTILEVAEHKKSNPQQKLVVSGCLTQRYKTQLKRGLPEVDLFIGTDQFHQIGDLIDTDHEHGEVFAKRSHYLYSESLPRINTLSKFSAYVKVAEGCGHNCAFCIIPAIRGKLRSRHIDSVVAEVSELASGGVLEVNLIAQDLAAFGRDRGRDELVTLLRQLTKVSGLQWLRLLYLYPENISDEFLEVFAAEPKLVKYLDVPMQHGSDAVLQRMNRQVTRHDLKCSIARVREVVPDVAIRTSVMVGFPGESDNEFAQLLDFVREVRFEHLGCFSYSQEDGTLAGRMPDQIADELKQQRRHRIMECQAEISKERQLGFVGQTLPVLINGISRESGETHTLYEGRLATQAPEVDGLVLINEGTPIPGKIQPVTITESHTYDLVGTVHSP